VSESYLTLSQKDQRQILQALSMNANIKRDALLLEKDVWICWALEFLFKMPNRLPMAFKGGTSLSKAFRVIDRFSEDVDITIDYKAFDCEDPFAEGVSKTKVKNISQQIKTQVTDYIDNVVIPYYQQIIAEQFKENAPAVELDEDGETLHLNYSSVLQQKSKYVLDSVRLEFGGRNLVTPSNTHIITADIAEHMNDLSFPRAEAIVLSPEKTYWEKLTLIHTECNRLTFKGDANRISRHWYDIFMLSKHDIGKQAATNRALLKEVVKIKKIFYNSGFAKYDDCLNGGLRLVPNSDYIALLKDDFNNMVENKMFYGEQPDFNHIIEQLALLEKSINAT
jgi:hypothetical protein